MLTGFKRCSLNCHPWTPRPFGPPPLKSKISSTKAYKKPPPPNTIRRRRKVLKFVWGKQWQKVSWWFCFSFCQNCGVDFKVSILRFSLKIFFFDFKIYKNKVGYTQSPIIRNGPIRLGVEFWGKFKKRALDRSDLRNAWKNLRNAEHSDFHS